MDPTTDSPEAKSTKVASSTSNTVQADGTILRTFIPLGDIIQTSNNKNDPNFDHALMEARLKAALEKTFGFLKTPQEGAAAPSPPAKGASAIAPRDGETWSTPENGKYYYIKNIGNRNAQWLDVFNASTDDDALVISTFRQSPVTPKQVWRIVKKGDNGAYTIQNACTLIRDGKIRNDKKEKSYLRVKEISKEQKLVHGAEAFKWKIDPAGTDSVAFKLKPYDGENDSDLVLSTVTDPASIAVTEKAQDVESAAPQLRPELANEDTTKKNKLWARQLWAFVEVPGFVLSDQRWL